MLLSEVRLNHRYMRVGRPARAMPTPASKIHVTLPGDVHKRLRVKVALEDTTIQNYVERLVTQAVAKTKLPGDE